MSTNDVPGANAANNDQLAMGCWAEHEDGSYILVLSTENDEVIFSMFDTKDPTVPQFNDKLPRKEFERHFSWDSKNSKSIKWTWHDKTPFPWDLIIKHGASKDGVMPSSAGSQIESAAAVMAKILGINKKDFNPEDFTNMMEKESPKNILKIIQSKIDECPVGSDNKKDKKKKKKLKKLLKKQNRIQAKLDELV